ncbi:MAG TPA: DNA recombination protein RmuC [Brevibacterium sp.]|nr:DNA recombination protein RmuC [Brevibacterium sp.]
MEALTLAAALVLVLAAGIAIGWWLGSTRARAHLQDRLVRAETTAQILSDRSEALEADAQVAGELTAAVGPLTSDVRSLAQHVTGQDRQQAARLAGLDEQLRQLALQNQRLQTSTHGLLTALSAGSGRGDWGEIQLRRIVELAGMTEHIDFDVEVTATTDAGRIRPDMVVRLPGEAHIVIDAKAPLSGLDADGEDAAPQGAQARAVRRHVTALSKKSYWQAFSPTPRFVVCFIPSDGLLAAAGGEDPSLIEDALAAGVVLASPSTLLGLLKTVALNWQQADLSRSAQQILDLGRDLHARVVTLTEHLTRMGSSLDRSVEDYNRLVGSFESRFLPTARRLSATGVSDASLADPEELATRTRGLTAREFIPSETSHQNTRL